MKSKTILLAATLLLCYCFSAAQEKNPQHKDSALLKPQESVTQGSVTIEGKRLDYKAIAGTVILKDKRDTPTCSMFYTAYFKADEDPAKRPLTFIYNGGPGSATLWLHIGAWGPQKIYLNDAARTHAPYKMVNNDYSLLDASDLVFIDAPGAGFSKIITKEMGGAGATKDFYGIDQDANAFASFIMQFLTNYNRWTSPKYLFGESYGTFRSAVVANLLETNDAVNLDGVILLSQLLSYNNMSDVAESHPGDELPYELALPSAAATAWYHHKVPNRPEKLVPFLKEVEHFAMNDYALALNKGSLLDSNSYNQIAEKIHSFTGLPLTYIRKSNLRINGPKFEHELLGDSDQITGRLDSRFSGAAMDPLSEYPDYDPMDSYIDAAFVGAFNNYIHAVLKYGEGKTYHSYGDNIIDQWDFKRKGFVGFPNVMPDLAHAMIYNPDLKVMLNMGYFDLGTPYFEGEYEMHHLPMPASLQKNIEYDFYYSGHMVYLHPEALEQLHDNVAKFIESTH